MTTSLPRSVSIVADDLTGAADTVVQFRLSGWDAYLLLREASADSIRGNGSSAISVSLDTRALDPQAARERTRQGVAELVDSGADRVYVKIDSTLRGSVPAQIDGALAAWSNREPAAFAVICPAYPAMGRTITAGLVTVNGVPLTDSPAGSDPVTPVTSSQMAELIPGSVHVPTAPDAEAMVSALSRDGAPGARLVVDAETAEDLAILGEAIARLGSTAVPVGSAGLAGALARAYRAGADGAPDGEPDADGATGPVLVVATSLNAVSLRQAEVLAEALPDDVRRFVFASADLADHDGMRRWARQLPDGRDDEILLVQPTTERRAAADHAAAAAAVARGIAVGIAALIESRDIGALILVGGDGAEAVLAELGASAIRVEGSAAEGVPRGHLVGGRRAGLAVATKAGGFGGPHTLHDLITTMRTTAGGQR